MASESIRQQVITNLMTNLAAISKTSGYWNDISSSQVADWLVPIDAVEASEMPKLMITSGVEGVDRKHASHIDSSTWEVVIIGYVHSTDMDEIRTMLERLIRDVRIAVLADMTFGGLSIRVKIGSIETDEGSLAYEGYGAFAMILSTEYQYSWDSP